MSDPGRGNIVITGAHPDDIAHSMGGTAWLLKDRYRLHVLCMTKGDGGIKDKSREEAAAIREEEERAACRLLGANLRFMGQTDGQVFAERELCETMAAIFDELKPAAVFTLWPINVPDHAATQHATMKAMNMADIYCTSEFYMYESGPGGQTNQFEPDIYVNIDTVVDQKRELIRCHRSQNPDEEAVERRLQRNIWRGKLARCDYAEPFRTPWPLMGTRWGRRAGCLLLDI